jgi:hypothetical protein
MKSSALLAGAVWTLMAKGIMPDEDDPRTARFFDGGG